MDTPDRTEVLKSVSAIQKLSEADCKRLLGSIAEELFEMSDEGTWYKDTVEGVEKAFSSFNCHPAMLP